MNLGTRTTIEYLTDRLLLRWVPKWYGAFCHPEGGFYERLGHSFQPITTGSRRLLTQCRQLAMYSNARVHIKRAGYCADLQTRLDWVIQNFHVPSTGGWRYSIGDDGAPLDTTYDLYTHGFVIFSLSHYYRTHPDAAVKHLADETLGFVDRHFRISGLPGLVEALDGSLSPLDKMRRHESHMHFLEGCLFAYDTWGDATYMRMAEELVGLFFDYFYPEHTASMGEYYTAMLEPHPEQGHVTEPGHYYEWIWLLKKYARQKGTPDIYDETCLKMLGWANHYGWDQTYGGIYDELNPDGSVLSETKRLWPFTEGLKANALMLDCSPDRQALKAHMAAMVAVFEKKYMQQRGFWVEWLQRDMAPATEYMPGTTPYHVYFGVVETWEIVAGRGKSVSLRAGPMAMARKFFWSLSAAVRRVRLMIKGLLAPSR